MNTIPFLVERYSRTGKPWTEVENDQLLERIKNKVDITEICLQHKRLPHGILHRVTFNGYDLDLIHGFEKSEFKELIKIQELLFDSNPLLYLQDTLCQVQTHLENISEKLQEIESRLPVRKQAEKKSKSCI